MPGGAPEAWPLVKDMLQSIAAKVESTPCCDWVGEGGAVTTSAYCHFCYDTADVYVLLRPYMFPY